MGAGRVVYRDRRGRSHAVVVWRADGALDSAVVRTAAGTWVSIEPRAGVLAPWGAIDRLWLGAEDGTRTTPLTVLGAVDWARVTTIPPLADPARLPPGTGTAVLNLLATLAREQGVKRLVYRGPYPTEALFLALLECFRTEPATGDLLAHFMANDLAWTPAPFVGSFEDTAYVQWREDRVEKVVWRGRTYYRARWGAVRRVAPLRVHDDGARVLCSLWALDQPIAHHLAVEPDGVPRIVGAAAETTPARARALAPGVREGLIAIVIAQSAPPLADALGRVTESLALAGRALALDLARVDDHEIAVATTLTAVLRRRLASEADPRARAHLALVALTDVATTIGDPLRVRAQAWLAAAPAEVQAAALERRTHDPDVARAITAAAAAILASGGMDDEPDVEGDEGGHRHDRQRDVGDP